ncbi:T9SS type A sorting domain-containing protein [Aureivirga marina]|uniref:T9SS type A sorting domain-containing protein n=1 Tax=Aureivirga marina TaxID=1182451 RepID=UPI0018CA3303|nr:T9SS type A sorting domain-containing protein [Aureivirga marina]
MKSYIKLLCALFIVNMYAQTSVVDNLNRPIDLSLSETGEIYLCEYGNTVDRGEISKLIFNEDGTVDKHVFISDIVYPRAICVVGDYLYYPLYAKLYRINITEQNPVPELISDSWNTRDILFHDGILYLGEEGRLSKIDLTQENLVLEHILEDLNFSILSLAIKDEYLYFNQENNIWRIDINEENPEPFEIISDMEKSPYAMIFINNQLLTATSHTFPESSTFITYGKITQYDMNFENTPSSTFFYEEDYDTVCFLVKDEELYMTRSKINSVQEVFKITLENLDIQKNNTLIKGVYPNPSIDKIFISGIEKDFTYKIFDINGHLLLKGKNTNQEEINIDSLKSGIYSIMIKSGNSTLFKKILKK